MNDDDLSDKLKDKFILELMELIDEQHEMITFLLSELSETETTTQIQAVAERIGQKIKRTKDSRIAAILVRQVPKLGREN